MLRVDPQTNLNRAIRRAHARRLLESYPFVKTRVAKTAASAVELAVRGLRNGSFVVVVCASPTGERTTAHTRAAVAAVAAHETLVEATRVAQVAGEDKHHRAAPLLLASSGDDADAARSAGI